MSSSTYEYDGGLPSIDIEERGEAVIQNCPSSIREQLQQAAFSQESKNVFIKQKTTADGDGEYKVAEATLENDELTVSVKDVVGVIDLTPTSRLTISPKIGWSQILNMFVAIQRQSRSIEYHGIPIEEFLSNDLDIEDIFVVLGINYIDSFDSLERYGFTRMFENVKEDKFDSHGKIDITRTLMNHANGNPKHHYIKKEINYNTIENSLILCAGKQLLRLFQRHSGDYDDTNYYQIFSSVERKVRRLENLGVSASHHKIGEYKNVNRSDLPRQRSYYEDIINISKSVVSSSIGRSLSSGKDRLTVDYILRMDSLFEEYSQIALESAIKDIKNNVRYEGVEDVRVEKEPSIQVFKNDFRGQYRPDHVLYKGDDAVCVFDSKYYAEKDPTVDSYGRSRMISYAYLLDIDEMAFLCPNISQTEKRLRGTNARMSVLSSGDEFRIEQYHKSIKDHLKSLLEDYHKSSEFFGDLAEYPVCYPDIGEVQYDEISSRNVLRIGKSGLMAHKIVSELQKAEGSLAPRLRDGGNAKKGINNAKQELRSIINKHSNNYHFCIPLYEDDSDCDRLKMYFIETNQSGEIVDVSDPEKLEFSWD